MKKVIALFLTVILFMLGFCGCRTVEDTKPKNETANPNCVYFL